MRENQHDCRYVAVFLNIFSIIKKRLSMSWRYAYLRTADERSLLRETNRLPYGYLRAFFRFKYRDDVDAAARAIAHKSQSSFTKLKRLRREYRRLRAANDGDPDSFVRLLEYAYGRTGKLRRELLEPFLHDATAEPPPPIIPNVESSRPPIYTREMKALMTSNLSRINKKGLKPQLLNVPPSLPRRLDPNSEEARLLGPLSKRREVNARWRFFTEESKRVMPPLQVSVVDLDRESGTVTAVPPSEATDKMQHLGLIRGQLQGTGLLESLESMVNSRKEPADATQKQKDLEQSDVDGQVVGQSAPVLPTKFLRRAHQRLLGKVPVLTFCRKTSTSKGKVLEGGSYDITLPKQANSPNLIRSTSTLPLVDEVNIAWIRKAEEMDKQRSVKKAT
ncbi:uncharacterized protein FOMMEDRAFT_27599 [Fomitiporia mediterranea MF3/22]|uniref:uncharacterized protein n=1 Tax=Fomitiporia mediterranea (strain MF3/22) TaxID=694068 RepID=UPI0004407B91|nr:uncharacterized protein FOMMEDRAFT_27599 [Fomitiporia mediterranea MF3/22]EJD03694.1 hypothetical protein FOMMEDRAFT_27599 [Fomitiporia mediterranea MF3/22]